MSKSDDARRSNNFDLLRLLLASMVVLEHCWSVSGEPNLSWVRYAGGPKGFGGPGTVAVQGFFAISGYLVVASYERSSSLESYFLKRARRILPAYWAALIFALFLGAAISTLNIAAFLGSPETWKFAMANIAFANFLHPSLPGVFANNPKDNFVNGPLWTIKVEIMFYLFVPVLVAACRRFGNLRTTAVLFALSVIFRTGFMHVHLWQIANQLPGQLSFFLVGTLVHYHRHWFQRHAAWMWLLAGLSGLGLSVLRWPALQTIATPLAVMCIALLLPHIANVARFGDMSYGTYVFHYPVIQSLVALGIFHAWPLRATGITAATVALLAFASWHVVEAPFLQGRVGSRKKLAALSETG